MQRRAQSLDSNVFEHVAENLLREDVVRNAMHASIAKCFVDGAVDRSSKGIGHHQID